MTEVPKFSFAIIKHRGDLNHAETADGYKVHRQNKVWITEPDGMNGRFIHCSPDDVHFIYIDPMWTKIKGRWFAMCSCGSPAVITGYDAYKEYGSPTSKEESTRPGEMLICYQFLLNGKHNPINWDIK
jgi:hypothetical protein